MLGLVFARLTPSIRGVEFATIHFRQNHGFPSSIFDPPFSIFHPLSSLSGSLRRAYVSHARHYTIGFIFFAKYS